MRASEFPIQRRNGRSTGIDLWNEQRPMPYKHVESPAPEIGGPGNYDSLVDHWQILFRHRKTLLAFVVAGLVAAILISLIQTPIYRVRTSLEIQGTSFLESKGTNDTAGNYASPESYVETQVKLLQSESLLEHVIDKLKLQNEQPKSGLRAFTWRIHRMLQFSDPSGLPEREKLIREVERNLTVRTSGSSRLLEVTYESPDAKGAADFANTLVSQFIELSQEERWKAAQGTGRPHRQPGETGRGQEQSSRYLAGSPRRHDDARVSPAADGFAAAVCRAQRHAYAGTLQSSTRAGTD